MTIMWLTFYLHTKLTFERCRLKNGSTGTAAISARDNNASAYVGISRPRFLPETLPMNRVRTFV